VQRPVDVLGHARPEEPVMDQDEVRAEFGRALVELDTRRNT
jgi:hypothetical protein